MGISKVIGVAATALLVSAMYLKMVGMKLTYTVLLVNSFIGYLVTIAAHPVLNYPQLLGKRRDGGFPFWSMLLFGQFLVLAQINVLLKRMKRKEAVYHEVSCGLYVGGWPISCTHLPPGQPAVIDCTCELPRCSVISDNDYLCIATWDTRSPKPSDIESAIKWALGKRAQNKPIYIHCANGHGRSVCVMSALLVEIGDAEDWKAAEKIIREKRPRIRMNAQHRKTLEDWTTSRAT